MRRNRWWWVIRFADVPRPPSGDESADVDQRIDTASALKTLSSEHRLALTLRYYLDLPVEDVAEVLGISLSAAKARIRRALLAVEPSLSSIGPQQ